MRRALGLRDEPTAERSPRNPQHGERRPRRFVRDGEVPVVVVKGHHGHEAGDQPTPERLRAAEAALATERDSHKAAERRLSELQTQIQSLQAKLAHAELSHREALAAERQGREAAERAAAEAREGREAAERALAELRSAPVVEPVAAPTPPKRRGRPPASARTVKPVQPRAVARRAAAPDKEPEPIKWWLPSYRKKKS
jgi:hypothetical protein